ncbi:MAG: hypothetical protein AMXMBFR33_54950 [Candidatus Xenobia bacterium]|jgi:uncharacterized protein YcfJ
MNRTTVTRTYDRPVTTRQRLGSVPRDYVEGRGLLPQHGLGSVKKHDTNEGGPVEVYRDVPVYDEQGAPRLETVTETLSEKPYDPKKRSVGYAILGGLTAGAAAGSFCGPVGTVLGAVAGAVTGGVLGFRSAENDQVEEVWHDRPINHPRMEGSTEYTVPIPEPRERYVKQADGRYERKTSWRIGGYYHHHRPDIKQEKVGEYREPELEHTRKTDTTTGAALAVGAGLAIGLAVAFFGSKDD